MTGRISSSSQNGINVRTEFFDEIFIPHTYLFDGMSFDLKENVWIWNNDGNQFYMDKNELIRFRIEDEMFEDQLPVTPHVQIDCMEIERKPPYRVIVRTYPRRLIILRSLTSRQASAQQAGMGLVAWWEEEAE
jgi:DNA-directed RNA polymerase III subunit RPC8